MNLLFLPEQFKEEIWKQVSAIAINYFDNLKLSNIADFALYKKKT